MAYEQRDMSGSSFGNEKKEKQTQPDHKGSAKIAGVEYWMDTWVKTDKNGRQYFSHAFKPKQQQQAPSAPPTQQNATEDDLPF